VVAEKTAKNYRGLLFCRTLYSELICHRLPNAVCGCSKLCVIGYFGEHVEAWRNVV